ncbi:Hypothetical protein A7982_08659 [Minicystis rosea]|nr:Hypothetical protein A7982_08659 [Minicystis rosea]
MIAEADRPSRMAARVNEERPVRVSKRSCVVTTRLRLLSIAALSSAAIGCGGGGPLLHPAHVLAPGAVSVGAGLSGQLALKPSETTTTTAANAASGGALQDLGVAAGVAPWVSGRMGVAGDNDFGLTYSGRAIRVDGRHAFSLGKPTLSIGLGASAIMARRPGDGNDVSGVFGGGADLPILIGVKSPSDIYSVWFGPRAGFEILAGRLQLGQDTAAQTFDVQARHFYGMLVAGVRVGFRHVHVAIELDAGYHRVDGTFKSTGSGETSTHVQQITLTPAGALEVSF